jgi:hypothetical protein
MTLGGVYFTITTNSAILNIFILIIVGISTVAFFIQWFRLYLATFVTTLKRNKTFYTTVGKYCGPLIKKLFGKRDSAHQFKVKEIRTHEESVEASSQNIDQSVLNLQADIS